MTNFNFLHISYIYGDKLWIWFEMRWESKSRDTMYPILSWKILWIMYKSKLETWSWFPFHLNLWSFNFQFFTVSGNLEVSLQIWSFGGEKTQKLIHDDLEYFVLYMVLHFCNFNDFRLNLMLHISKINYNSFFHWELV